MAKQREPKTFEEARAMIADICPEKTQIYLYYSTGDYRNGGYRSSDTHYRGSLHFDDGDKPAEVKAIKPADLVREVLVVLHMRALLGKPAGKAITLKPKAIAPPKRLRLTHRR